MKKVRVKSELGILGQTSTKFRDRMPYKDMVDIMKFLLQQPVCVVEEYAQKGKCCFVSVFAKSLLKGEHTQCLQSLEICERMKEKQTH